MEWLLSKINDVSSRGVIQVLHGFYGSGFVLMKSWEIDVPDDILYSFGIRI